MRIAAFSDVHGNLPALQAVLRAIDGHRPVQLIVAAGDHCLIGDQPAEAWDALQEAGCLCLFGNEDDSLFHDRVGTITSPWIAANLAARPIARAALGPDRLAAIHALPRFVRLSPALGQDILFVHANVHGPYGYALSAQTPDATLARLYGDADARVICCGHYHQAAVREWNGVTLVNVASVSVPVDRQPLAGYTILDWDRDSVTWNVAQYRVPVAASPA